ncbi:MAG: asparaginase [Clostridia bacterium]|nr:asparaginase [Clostridia bacterium]
MSLLTIETRGQLTENRHFGCIAVVGENGVIASSGAYREEYFFRSSSKPIQALPVLLLGLDKEYGLSEEECAIMAGSNAGETYCTDVVTSLMQKTGVTEDDLVMNPRWPSHEATRYRIIGEGGTMKKLYHGCTPKHIGLMLVQRKLTGDAKGYHLPESAAQRLVRYTISLFTGTPYEEIKLGIDGCGVPVFGVPGDALAKSYLYLAAPDLIPDAGYRAVTERMTSLMHKYPHLIRGREYLCTLLNSDDNVVAKGGASGVYTFGLKKQRVGVMYKMYDGTETSWQVIAAEILRQLYPGDCAELIQKLDTTELIGTTCHNIRCMTGETVGEMKPVFTLEK